METIRYWRVPSSGHIELVHAAGVCSAMPRQAAQDYKFALIERGSRAFYYRGSTRTAAAGEIVAVRPGEVNGSHPAGTDPSDILVLTIPPAVLDQDPDPSSPRPIIPSFASPLICDPGIAASLRRIARTFETPTSSLEQQVRLQGFFETLRDRCAGDEAPQATAQCEAGPVARVRAFLEENYAEDVMLGQLAELAGLEPSYLCRVFRQETGTTPHAYLSGIRIDRAKRLIRSGEPIGSVALATGFYDQSHFTHAFTRFAKITPARYARAVS